jgi:hypothetical protein
VVRDGNLITSRLPNDLDMFCVKISRVVAEHAGPCGDGHCDIQSRREPDVAVIRTVLGEVTDLDPEFLNAEVPCNHMFGSFLPRLARLGIGTEVIRGFLVDTPRRIFELTPA